MNLFEPGRIGMLSIRNRIVMAAMATWLHEPDGRLSKRDIDFYVARARGGVGLIVTMCVGIERQIETKAEDGFFVQPMADKFAYVDRFSQLADALHDYGTKLAIQLTPGLGRVFPRHIIQATEGMQLVAPSAQPCFYDPSVTARALTTEEIERIVKAFGFAARVVSSAGVDAIEIHGHLGYLIDQFMTPIWNHRKDKYGGDLDGRLRFPLEIVEAIKSNAGRDFPVIFKCSIKHYLEGGREVEESLEIAKRLEEAGVDAIDISARCFESVYGREYPTYGPPGQYVELAEAVKKVVKIPVIVGGALGYPELAEKVLEEGKADFISLGRGLLTDPEWPNKVKEGRFDDVKICLRDHEGCMGRTRAYRYASCTLNPAAGMEREFTITPSEGRKSVLVVGGGPAGMEAARVAALRGHEVTLWERSSKLGGNLVPASVPDFKQDYKRLIEYLSTQIKKLGVKVELHKEATAKLIQKAKPEVLIIATGATPVVPEISGIEKASVVTAVDLLLGKKEAGETVVIAGGGLIGCEVGLYLAQKAKKVTIVEMTKNIASNITFVDNRTDLLQRLAETGVELLTETKLMEIIDDGAVVNGKLGRRTIRADTVVLAVGLRSEEGLLKVLGGNEPTPIAIGDCVEPRKIINAIWEGFRIGRLI